MKRGRKPKPPEKPARSKKNWSAEDERYLEDKWGTVSIPGIARHLNRSVDAVKIRAQRLGLGPALMGGDYVSLNQLLKVFYGSIGSSGYVRKSWVEERGLPVHTKQVVNNKFLVVYLDEFWEWAEKNRSFLDFSKMEPYALGEEPAWVAEQRKRDFRGFAIQRKDPWTSADDSRLIMLVQQNKYGYAELSKMLRRSAGAIQRRLQDLGVKERPLKADAHGPDSKWTDEDFEMLAEGIRQGEGYMAIGEMIGKSEKAIRGKVYFVYLTEKADKVREMMGDGPWGSGAPEPRVKQAVHLSRTRTETKDLLERLCGVLRHRTQNMKNDFYDSYFQRSMCQNWNDRQNRCMADCDDCDSCTEFIRIRPQYCVRCGATFFEREKNIRCPACRAARKRMGARKYRHLYGGAAPKEEIE